MITRASAADAARLCAMLRIAQEKSAANAPVPADCTAAPLASDVFTLCMRAAYRCYGTQHTNAAFYFVSVQTADKADEKSRASDGQAVPSAGKASDGLLYVQGRSALYAGPIQDAQELEAFLQLLQIKTFQSNSMLLPDWADMPRYLMHLPAGTLPDVTAAAVDEHPSLWNLAHSGVLADIDPDAWYADACARVNHGVADIRAVAMPDAAGALQYAATAGAYAIDTQSVFLTAVATKPEYRGRGFACTILSSLARSYADKDAYLLCAPQRRSFYEQLGFVLARPVCEYHAPPEA
ncbi:MAG: hypothetical protein RSG59_06345 [Ruthenibacterium sp.]